jgi:hypothetical protein
VPVLYASRCGPHMQGARAAVTRWSAWVRSCVDGRHVAGGRIGGGDGVKMGW